MRTVELVVAVVGALVGARLPWTLGCRRRCEAVTGPRGAPTGPRGASTGPRGAPTGPGGAPVGPRGASGPRRDEDARTAAVPAADVAVVLDLLDVALASGASLPGALQAVGCALGGADGSALAHAASALVLGAPWREAWGSGPERLRAVADCLELAWSRGSAPGAELRARAAGVRRERRREAREAAGRLGVHLVLPLGLCFLPAFVLIGLVPVLVSLGAGLMG